MSKYIKLEDAIDALYSGFVTKTYIENKLKDLPSIDIARCKECMHKYVTGTTTQYYVCDFMDAQFDENGFCHHGERIEE